MSLYIEHLIKEKLNAELRKIRLSMQKEDQEIRSVLEKEGYSIKYINFQNNSINGA